MKFTKKHVEVEPPKRPKKLTATRFATVLGLNPWSTPFEVWCAITRTYEKPFEDTIYTTAGKVIEPKVISYLSDVYFMDLKSPTDVYGKDYFSQTRGDFFPETSVLGGMWDAIGEDTVVEIKTTKRAEDWKDDVPIYYKLQAALYAYLLGMDDVTVSVSFLTDSDYLHPENFEPSYKNTKLYSFKMSEAFPDFEEKYVFPALKWWNEHIDTGISPDFSEKKDAEILKALRTATVDMESDDLTAVIEKAEELQKELDEEAKKRKDKEKTLKTLTDKIKAVLTEKMGETDTKAEVDGNIYKWTVSKTESLKVDSDKLKADGLLEKYSTPTTTYTLRKTAKKG